MGEPLIMLTTEIKQRINTCRDILVGKLPDPKSQVLQITNALIYKFMDDQDRLAETLGGKASFFVNGLAPYSWHKLFDAKFTNQERADKYVEGLEKLSRAAHLPALFQEIFKEAYVPFRDGRVITMFITEINKFDYTHSEELGNAYEYLLSIMGSQGDAGQFRTPRHIIEFLVDVVDPQKGETIYDPAAGTAGFLIAAYNHILEANEKLTAGERRTLAANISGVDISPDMAKMARVNLYLHGFTTPNILEGDTLTDEPLWGKKHDVILANPPFMSPKGGIEPHDKFSIKAKRSEVLFVDYIAEHLKLKGRAGIIVPEGIVERSGTVYRELRKMLVDDGYLHSVISLPAGLFQPYSNVKTSMLILDRERAQAADEILFVKVEKDGYSLTAHRTKLCDDNGEQAEWCPNHSDLPLALDIVKAWRNGDKYEVSLASWVSKIEIAKSGEYSLGADRYREFVKRPTSWPHVALGEVCDVVSGYGFPTSEQGVIDGEIPFLKVSDMNLAGNEKYTTKFNNSVERSTLSRLRARSFPAGTVIFPKIGAAIATNKKRILFRESAFDNNVMGLVPKEAILSEFLYYLLLGFDLSLWASSSSPPSMRKTVVEKQQIPLPPIELQRELVAKLNHYQKIVDGSRQIVENFRSEIEVEPEWPVVLLGDVIDVLEAGVSVNSEGRAANAQEIGVLKTSSVTSGAFRPEENKVVRAEEAHRVRCPVRAGRIIISRMNTEALVGASAYVDKDYPNLFLPDRLWQAVISRTDVEPRYLQTVLASPSFRKRISQICGGTSGSMKNVSQQQLLALSVPLPSLKTQRRIVEELRYEEELIDANRKLTEHFGAKIQTTIDRVWGAEATGDSKGAAGEREPDDVAA